MSARFARLFAHRCELRAVAADIGDLVGEDEVLLAPNSLKRVTFSFEGRRIRDAAIIDYDDFLRCKFDDQTRFVNSIIFGGNFSSGIKTNLRALNLDETCDVNERIRIVVRARDGKTASDHAAAEKTVRALLRQFRHKGSFHKPRKLTTITSNVGAMPFHRMLEIAIDVGLVVDGVGQGNDYLGINPTRVSEVEDFVDQNVQSAAVRAAVQRVFEG